MNRSEQTANRQLTQTAKSLTVNGLGALYVSRHTPNAKFVTAFDVARKAGVNPYNDTRGMAVRS